MKRKQRSNHLGEAVRTAREAAGLSQIPLSKSMNYDYNVVSAWENGSKPLVADEWFTLCGLLPGLSLKLAVTHAAEFSTEGRKLKPRPSRLDPKTTAALNAVVNAKAAGVPVIEVASAAGLDYVGFWKMLKGTSNPTLAQLHQLADYFQVDADVLMGRRPVESAPYARVVDLLSLANVRLEEAEKELTRARHLNDLLLAEKG